MNTSTYKNLLRVLEKWPIDSTKLGRDLGLFIRQEIVSAFNPIQAKKLNLAVWDEVQASLNRIASNRYKELYPTSSNVTTSTGLTAEVCNLTLSDEFNQKFMKEESKYQQIRNKISRKQ